MLDRRRIGHTGITWPTQPVEEKVAAIASIGYRAFETFGRVLQEYPGGVLAFREVLDRHGVAYAASFCPGTFVDPATVQEDIERVLRWARLTKEAGGETIVVSGRGPRREGPYTSEEYAGLVHTLNTLGVRIRDEIGLVAALHPHTNTPIESPEEIRRVMDGLDPSAVSFGPDTGQIAQAGGDPVEIVGRYRDLVHYVHVKDYGGTPSIKLPDGTVDDPTGHVGYVPIGSGIVDFDGVLGHLRETGFNGWLMVELEGTPHAPRPPAESAAISYRALTAAVERANLSA